MRPWLASAGTPGSKAIGVNEISIRKGHNYRIAVSGAYEQFVGHRHPGPSSL
jgi:hypothetical protein